VRQIALVASGPEGVVAESWLRAVAGVSATRVESLAELALETTDAVWLHGAGRFVSPALLDWLRGGGRLLATLEAAMLPFDLGLEPHPPDDQLDAVWRDPPALLGLAGAGPHPLFAGLGGGAYVWAASTGEPYRWCAYRRTRPGRGRVVGVLWQPDELDPAGAVAWEHAVGDGGILCIGALAQLQPADSSRLPELHQLLRNALAGAAIPHRERRGPAAVWPTRVGAAQLDPALAIPALPSWNAGWPPEVTPSSSGRRLEVDAAPGATAVHTPGLSLVRAAHAAGAPSVPAERWFVAHELPVAAWEVTGQGEVELGWLADLAAGEPLGAAARGQLRYAVSADGTRARVAAENGSTVIFAALGGRLGAAAEGGGVALRCAGRGRLSLLVVGATAEDDLARTLRLAARDGWAGLLAQSERHRAQLLRTTIELRAPDPALADAVRQAILAGDARLVEFPGVGRVLADRVGGPQMTTALACRAAEVLVAAGHRSAARELLRSVLGARDFAGRVPDRVYESGLTEHLDGSGALALARLASRYLAWTGDAERVAGLAGAAAMPPGGRAPSALPPDPVTHVLHELWGIEPDAPHEAVTIRPRLPDGWRDMRLARLRVGATTLELECRRRPGRVVVRVRRAHGPAITATVGLGAGRPAGIAVDEVELGGMEARFVADGSHEVDLRL
jgi:hypothetical protein